VSEKRGSKPERIARNLQPAIQVTAIDRRFGGVHALRGVSLEVYHGEILGLVGHNGAGKTTLIRILTGDLHADGGEIRMDGQPVSFASVRDAIDRGVGVVRQELNLVPELTLSENIFLGNEEGFTRGGWLDRKAMAQAARPLLERVGLTLDPTLRLKTLSIGDQQMVAAARALRNAGRVLFLDEPTSSLTPWEADNLFAQVRLLAESGVAIVYISHRIDEVVALCDRVVVLRDGAVVGTFSSPATAMKEIIDTMAPGSQSVKPRRARSRGEVILEARGMRVGRQGPASFQLCAGEVVGFFGLVGSGRSAMARAMVGDIRLDEGEILLRGRPVTISSPWHGYRHGIAYLSEDRKAEGIFQGMSLGTNITVRTPRDTVRRSGWLNRPQLSRLAGEIIRKLDIRPGDQAAMIEAFSGGNQQKAALGRLLADTLDVFVLDEPTHGIDVAAKRDLLNLLHELADQGKSVAFISSELPELMAVADRVLVMRRGQVVGEFSPAVAQERELIGLAAGEKAQ
jgi:ABC-type sugar transport system ATPase subunit